MSAVHPPSNLSTTGSDTSVFNEGVPIPSAFVRTEVIRLLQREQEKAVALLETSPLLSYLFLTYVIQPKATPDPPITDHSEELSALKLRSEKVESELATAQAALTEAHDVVESLRGEVQQLKSDLMEDRSRGATILEEKEREKERLRKDAQTYKSQGDGLQKTIANQQLDMARVRQHHIADKAALQTRLDELQRRFDELSRRQEEVATPADIPLEETASGRTSESPERSSTPIVQSQHVPQPPTLPDPAMQPISSPEVTPSNLTTHQAPVAPSDAQMSDPSSSPVRLSRSQKFKARRVAKKQAQEARGDVVARPPRTEVLVEAH